jgi:hypothetical protein
MQHNKQLISQLEAEVVRDKSDRAAWVNENLLCLAKARQDWLKKLYRMVKEAPQQPEAR